MNNEETILDPQVGGSTTVNNLPSGNVLQGGKYKIIDKLGQGGFGITYLAIQSGLERKVAIKEFFMKDLCERDKNTNHVSLGTEGSREAVKRFREKFLKEARNIARLNHPNIVRIIDVFEENGTAYYVMEYVENGSLADIVKHEGNLSESVATRYILQVADALDYIHQKKMNHFDVKPANIMLNEKDEVVLIDFGLAKQYDAVTDKQTSTTPVGISEGYAPLEQYDGSVKTFAPEIDIYSLGATFFKLLTGSTPPSAAVVNNEGVPVEELQAKGVSDNAINVIVKCMESRKRYRIMSIADFRELMSYHVGADKPKDDVVIQGAQNPAASRSKKPLPPINRWVMVAFVLVNILAFAFGVVIISGRRDPDLRPNVFIGSICIIMALIMAYYCIRSTRSIQNRLAQAASWWVTFLLVGSMLAAGIFSLVAYFANDYHIDLALVCCLPHTLIAFFVLLYLRSRCNIKERWDYLIPGHQSRGTKLWLHILLVWPVVFILPIPFGWFPCLFILAIFALSLPVYFFKYVRRIAKGKE